MKTKLFFLSIFAILNLSNLAFGQTTTVTDDAFETYLETHNAQGAVVPMGDPTSMGNATSVNDPLDDKVLTNRIDTVTTLSLDYLGIKSLEGLEAFAALKNFTFQGNQAAVTIVDLTANTSLETIYISGFSNLANFNINGLVYLTELTLVISAVTNLDVSSFVALTKLQILQNPLLTSINMKNGFNANITLVNVRNNPLLNCILADTSTPPKGLSGWRIDAQNIFDATCSQPITYVPDTAFENYLETNSFGNGIPGDQKVFTNNINTIINLNVSNLSISDLTGIEDFRDLESLGAANNSLTSFNLSSNINLKGLTAGNNNLTSVDLSSNINLVTLQLNNNNIRIINISSNVNLEFLNLRNNNLTSLDVSMLPKLGGLAIYNNQDLEVLNVKNGNNAPFQLFLAYNNPKLTCIEVDDVSFFNSNFPAPSSIDNTASYSINCNYPETSVPDVAFENYLETHDRDGNVVAITDPNNMGNGIANDAKVFTHRINTVTTINVSNIGLALLTGIEGFRDLEDFNAYGGNTSLTSVDLSNNLKLKKILVTNNANLTTVTFGNLPEVTWVQLSFNKVSSVDISGLPKLDYFFSQSDKLSTLNTASNPNLKNLVLTGNQLTTLDVSSNPKLENLKVRNNQLTILNLSNNPSLTQVLVGENQLTNLNLSNNPKLVNFEADNNKLTSLNLKNGNNTILPGSYGPNFTNFPFDIRNNPNLTCIQVNDVAYSTTTWTAIDSQHTFSTSCANSLTYVPDDAFETYLETHAADGSVVPFGDPTSMGNGTGTTLVLDNYVFTNRIDSVIELVVNNMSISDMTGIEDFSALKTLRCSINTISSLDVSRNIFLEELVCGNNQIGSLDISKNVNLKKLWSQGNQLTTIDFSQNLLLEDLVLSGNSFTNIDVTQNTALTNLNVNNNTLTTIDLLQNINLINLNLASNQFTTIDLSQNVLLENLEISNNQLTVLNVVQNINLTRISAFANQLTTLDVSQNVKLDYLACSNNQLTSLNVKNGTNNLINTASFYAVNNPNLTCIEVSNVAYATTTWTNIDSTATFSTDCSGVWIVNTPPATTTILLAIAGLDADNDGKITLAEAAAFTGTLDLSGQSLTDVEGLQAFINVTKIDLQNNNITDFSPLTDASIPIIQKSTGKTKTQARTGAFNLEELYISNNNNVESLDVSKLTKLKKLIIKDNPKLITVSIQNGNNATITEFDSSNTPNLTCILVDNVGASYLSTWIKDPKNTFVATESECRAKVLDVDTFELSSNILIYPNPISDIINIKVQNGLKVNKVKIISILGKTIMEQSKNRFNISRLSKGIYLIKIITDKGIVTRKVIKR